MRIRNSCREFVKMFNFIKKLVLEIGMLLEFFFWNVWKMRAALPAGILSFLFTLYAAKSGDIANIAAAFVISFLAWSSAYIEGWDTRVALKRYHRNKTKKMMDRFRKEFGDEVVDAALNQKD